MMTTMMTAMMTIAVGSALVIFAFPKGLVSIGNGAFSGCKSLVSLPVFPEGLVSIGWVAFAGCSLDETSLKMIANHGNK